MKCNFCGDLFRTGEDFRDHLPCPEPKETPEPIVEVAREKLTSKVFVCISGSYSDKSVAAVFSKETDARRCEQLFNWDVEEREIDSIEVSKFPPDVQCFRATIHNDEVENLTVNDGPPDGWTPGVGSVEFYGSFWAKDKKHALDIAWEKLLEVSPHPAEALARNEKRKKDREAEKIEAAARAEREKANRKWLREQSNENRKLLQLEDLGPVTVTRKDLKDLGLVDPNAESTGIAFPWLKKT